MGHDIPADQTAEFDALILEDLTLEEILLMLDKVRALTLPEGVGPLLAAGGRFASALKGNAAA